MSERRASLARLDSDSSTSSANKSNTYQGTLDAILSPSRLAGLDAADVAPIVYNTYSFFSRIWSLRGRNLSMLVAPLGMLLLWGVGWQMLFVYAFENDNKQEYLASLDRLVSPILTPLSFLLTFRLGRAAVRFWDARSSAGKVIAVCRFNISTVSVGIISPLRARRNNNLNSEQNSESNELQTYSNESQIQSPCCVNQDEKYAVDLLCEYARWLAVFPIALKHHIRPPIRKGWDQNDSYKKQRYEIGTLLTENDAQMVILPNNDENGKPTVSSGTRVRDPPLVVLNRLHQLAYDIAYCTFNEDSTEFTPTSESRAMLYQQTTNDLNELMNAYGAMERIKNTPLPFAYAIHLRTFLLLYLFLWNMISVAEYGWISIPFLFLLNWALLGVEAAAVECESPFGYSENHLTLGKVAVLISRNIGQALVELGLENIKFI